MLKREIEDYIFNYLISNSNKILCITGARQIGKTYIIREVAKRVYSDFIEINMASDKLGPKLFKNVKTIDDFYLRVSIVAGPKFKEKNLIFIDEIQEYPNLLTLLKFLREDNKYRFICSGSLLGITLKKTTSIPIGSIIEKKMYPLSLREFLWASDVNENYIEHLKNNYLNLKELPEEEHNYIMHLFKLYLLIGGLPDSINIYKETNNIYKVREYQDSVLNYYLDDASKYDETNKLKVKRIYQMLPSNIDNKIKRLNYKAIEDKEGKGYSDYEREIEYLISSGIALETKAISNPKFPLIESSSKNLIKLYLNDVGLLTNILYKYNINVILDDVNVNLGAVYETYAACELKNKDYKLYYFDKRKEGEVDFLLDDYDNLCVKPIEIKSGKNSQNYRALPKIVNNSEYNVKAGYVFYNKKEVLEKNKIIHLPIYYLMFL